MICDKWQIWNCKYITTREEKNLIMKVKYEDVVRKSVVSPIEPQKVHTIPSKELSLSDKIKELHSERSYLVQLLAFHEVLWSLFSFSTAACNSYRWYRGWNTCWAAVSWCKTLTSRNNFKRTIKALMVTAISKGSIFCFNICPYMLSSFLSFMLTKINMLTNIKENSLSSWQHKEYYHF